MSTEQMSFFFTVLALMALGGGVVILAALVGAAVSPRVAARVRPAREGLAPAAVGVALVVAVGAVLGSLYYSEIANYVPCRLCWYQRIGMYPLVVVLGIAAVARDRGVWRYVLPLAALGAVVSLYHYQLQLFPGQGSGSCGPEASCTVRWVEQFGFASIPFMALCAFLSICALMLLARPQALGETEEP